MKERLVHLLIFSPLRIGLLDGAECDDAKMLNFSLDFRINDYTSVHLVIIFRTGEQGNDNCVPASRPRLLPCVYGKVQTILNNYLSFTGTALYVFSRSMGYYKTCSSNMDRVLTETCR